MNFLLAVQSTPGREIKMRKTNKSSYPAQKVVRASQKLTANNTKKSPKFKFKDRQASLPTPLDYYAKELKRFYPKKREATGLCPFHRDRNPSFSASLKSGAYICFACGARGKSIISFHMKKYGLSKEAAYIALGGGLYE
jgi:hypothetical protein